jgi:hypothetical protein
MILETNHVSLAAATTGTGSVATLGGICRRARIYAVWASGCTSGQVIAEEAHDPAYTGTWSPLATFNVQDGAVEAVDVDAGALLYLRARVSTTVAGGSGPSVTVRIVAV